MKCLLRRMLDQTEFLSDYGVRALSKIHEANPYVFGCDGSQMCVRYQPAESDSGLFGGNSADTSPAFYTQGKLAGVGDEVFLVGYKLEFKVPSLMEMAAQSEKETPIPKVRAKLHAAEWLERSIPGLSGAAKTGAEKKLGALQTSLGSKASPFLDLGGMKLELIYCKPGVFTMGSSEAPVEKWHVDARPPHRVEITRGFFLGKFEVTRGQFAAFVKATGYVTEAERAGNGAR